MIEINIHKKLLSSTGEMKLQVELEIKKGSFITLYGHSGVGKTSVLRIIAGLMSPDEGRIVVNGNTWVDTLRGINLRPQKRKVGFVFQDYSLFPNMTVEENLLFALGKGQDKKIVRDLIEIMELGALQKRKPLTLSGGQKQRSALARALVQRPELLMLDEPLSALDVEMRTKLQHYILQVHREYGITTILISHDISEILKMSDRILEMKDGKIVRQGKPSELFAYSDISGKFQFAGEIVTMEKQDFIFILTILIGNDLVKVIADEEDVSSLCVGDRVLIASKAFNPIIRKIE